MRLSIAATCSKYATYTPAGFACLLGLQIAGAYEEGGATCLSVLTDVRYFQGSFDNISLIRKAGNSLPIIAKEFVIEAYQLFRSRAAGADAVLLIAAVLPNSDLAYLLKVAAKVCAYFTFLLCACVCVSACRGMHAGVGSNIHLLACRSHVDVLAITHFLGSAYAYTMCGAKLHDLLLPLARACAARPLVATEGSACGLDQFRPN